MRSTSRWAALGAGLLLVTGATACAGDTTDANDDPRTALTEAIEALEDYDGIELGFGIDGDRDAIMAADEEIDENTADLVLNSSVIVRAAGEDESDAQAEVLVNLDEQQVLEVRVLPEQRFYVRVDLDAVATALDDPAIADGLDEAVGMAEMFGLGELATAVRAGDWVQLTGIEQLAEFASGASGGGDEDQPTEEEVEDVRERVVASLQRFVAEDVELTHVGEESAGERITATTTEGDLAGLFEEIATIASDVSGVDPADVGAEVPADADSDTPIDIDFWIDGGELSQIGFDLSQAEGEDALPEGTYLLVTIEEFTGSVDAPEESTEIDLFAIMGNLFGGGFGEGDLEGDGFEGEGLEDEGLEDGAGDEGELPGGECIPQEQLDELFGGDEEAQAEIDAAIEEGFIEVC
jgi:hypothetical protein